MNTIDFTLRLIDRITSPADFAGQAATKFVEFVQWLQKANAEYDLTGKAVAAFETVLKVMAAIPGTIEYIVDTLVTAIVAFDTVKDAALRAWDAIPAGAKEVGAQIVDGLIAGIDVSTGGLLTAVGNVAHAALEVFRSVFQIHSPSRVMAGTGEHISLGLAQGIDAGARHADTAMVGAGVQLSTRSAAGAQLALLNHIPRALAMNDNALGARAIDPVRTQEPNERQRDGRGVTIENLHVEITGVKDAADLESRFPAMMADWWETVALANGTG